MEESTWYIKQRSRVLRDYQQDTQRVWQDDAATEINGRYFRPHEEDSQQSLSALSMQLQLLNETDISDGNVRLLAQAVSGFEAKVTLTSTVKVPV